MSLKILHVMQSRYSLPPEKYGGTERVVWGLATNQEKAGHQVRYLWGKAKNLPDNAIISDKKVPIQQQIDDWPDIVHFHRPFKGELHKPYICTEHGNADKPTEYSQNCVFLSRKHAENHGAQCFVYNGLNWDEYGEPNLDNPKNYMTFLGKAKVAHKNLLGTVDVALKSGNNLKVLGGNRINIRRLPYFIWQPNIGFCGMVGGQKKLDLLKNSKALLFPVRWHEPFGLAITESLYLGAPVIATAYGSLPEIIQDDKVGFLSNNYNELIEAAKDVSTFDRKACHELAKTKFSSKQMYLDYQVCYERILDGEPLNREIPKSKGGFLDLLPID